MALSLSTTKRLQEAHRNYTPMPSGAQTEGAEMRGGRNGKGRNLIWLEWVYERGVNRSLESRHSPLCQRPHHLTARLRRDAGTATLAAPSTVTGTSTTAATRPSCDSHRMQPTICADLCSRIKKPSTIMILESLFNALLRVWEYLTFWWYYPPALSNMRVRGPVRDGDENALMVSGYMIIQRNET